MSKKLGLGTILNAAGIAAGGILGLLCGKRLTDRYQDTLNMACGISTLLIGISGALAGMLSLQENGLSSGRSMLIVLSLVPGAFIGELLDLESLLDRFGEWLKKKTGNGSEANFVNAFVTASLVVCIGAMAIIGSIQDGIYGDYSILATKAILDLVIILVMTCTLGKGCMFSAIPVVILQGSITILARWIQPLMTDAALANLSLIGSILIFCVGINLVWGKKVRVANWLPSIIFAVIFAFIPIGI